MSEEFDREGVDNVLFLESNVDPVDQPSGVQQAPNTRTRMGRLSEKLPNANTLPYLIAQAGRYVNSAGAPGGTNETAWRGLFDGWIAEAEQQAPTMKVDAWFKRTGLNKVTVTVDVENLSNDVFDPWENGGAVAVIGFEHHESPKIHLPNLMRLIDWMDFEDIVEGGQKVRLSNEFTLEVPADFGKLQLVAFVEYEDESVGRDIAGSAMATQGDPPPPDTTEPPEPTAPELSCTLSPSTAEVETGAAHSVRALVREKGGPTVAGAEVMLEVTDGPHAGESATMKTDATGEVSLRYTGTEEGTDTVEASGSWTHETGPITFDCGQASVTWKAPEPPDPVDPPDPNPEPDHTVYLPLVLFNHNLLGN